MINGLYYEDDVINVGKEFKIGQFVKNLHAIIAGIAKTIFDSIRRNLS